MYLQLLVHGCVIGRPIATVSKNCVPPASRNVPRMSLTSAQNSPNPPPKRPCPKPLVVVLAGPTACGKSAVAALLSSPSWATSILTGHARNNNQPLLDTNNSIEKSLVARGHVISADSVQVYTGVQIGRWVGFRVRAGSSNTNAYSYSRFTGICVFFLLIFLNIHIIMIVQLCNRGQ